LPKRRRDREKRIVVGPVDVSAVRHEREARRGHHMLAHLRTEAYPVYATPQFPAAGSRAAISYESNLKRIESAKKRFVSGTSKRAFPR
jgi:hypothetical protein